MPPKAWADEVHRELAAAGVRVVGYVPDAGHKRLIELCHADPKIRAVPLTTEEEGVGLAAGAWLGGERSVILMQSSGVGNIVNVLGMVKVCRFPLVMVVTMRGEAGEFNPWQVPMGETTARVLEAMGVTVRRADAAADIALLVKQSLRSAFEENSSQSVLVAQRVIGIKSFQEQSSQ